MSSDSNGLHRDFGAELAEIHARQNKFEHRDIMRDAAISDIKRESANHKDWIVKALGPLHDAILSTRDIAKDNSKRLATIEKVLLKVISDSRLKRGARGK